MRGNIVHMSLNADDMNWSAEKLYQYDYGQKLVFDGAELPESYEVYFSNNRNKSKPMIGDAGGVAIPDEFLKTGEDIYVWVFLHAGENDGETEFRGVIPVMRRTAVSPEEITPEQQSVITETLAALSAALAQTETNVTHYPKVVDGTWYAWDAEEGDFVTTGVAATGSAGNGIAGVQVRMVLFRQLAVCFFQFVIGNALGHAKDFIIISFLFSQRSSPRCLGSVRKQGKWRRESPPPLP